MAEQFRELLELIGDSSSLSHTRRKPLIKYMLDTIPTPTQSQDSHGQSPVRETNVRRFKLNHPKNYIAVPLATVSDANTEFLIREFAVNLPNRAQNGAIEAGLITEENEITPLGEAAVSTAVKEHGNTRDALEAFGELHGSSKRFVKVFPEWKPIAERIAFQYDVTSELTRFLREQGLLHLSELTWLLWKHNPALAERVFLHPSVSTAQEITETTRPVSTVLQDGSVYRCECTFQYKSFLFHSGVITERGDYTSRLNPATDVWELEPSFR